jgi:voltage-gated potassium channel Kch
LRRSRPREIARSLVEDRASSSLLTLLLVGILVLEFGSLTMLQLERNAPNANITTAPDALWYLVVTMSTVGYGDRYPVSTAGRALGTFVIVVGVGIFGTLTGYLANLFISPRKEQLAPNTPSTLAEARHRLEQVKELLNQQQAAVADLEAMLRGGDV